MKLEDVYINGDGGYVGAISGVCGGVIEQVCVSGRIIGSQPSSFSNINWSGMATIRNCYSTATLVSKSSAAAGIMRAPRESDKIENCHFEGEFQGLGDFSAITQVVNTIINCYSSKDGDNVSNILTFENWSISETKGADTIWYLDKEKGYPVFQWE